MKDSDQTRLNRLLRLFGCTERESAIYVCSLEKGKATVQELAQRLGANRITVHSAVERLLEKGLLFESRKGKKRIICPEAPDILYQLVQRREAELRVLKSSAEEALSLLSAVRTPEEYAPTVKFYEGVPGLKKMLQETLSAKGEVLVFSYVHLLAELLSPAYLEGYFKKRAAKGIHSRLLFPPCPFAEKANAKAKEYRIQIRLLPAEVKWRSGIFAWNDIIALLSYTRGNITCTIIENPDIAYFYRSVVFELSWLQAKPLRTSF